MILGFTGTRNGMSSHQREKLVGLLMEMRPTELHHGDCVGADDEAANLVHELFLTGKIAECKIVCHPPKDRKLRAFNAYTDVLLEEKPYLDRNRGIVDYSDILIAAPFSDQEPKRYQSAGGTWMTVRYAIAQSKRVVMLER